MVGPLVYDLAQQHVSDLLAERDRDRLAAQVSRRPQTSAPRLDLRRLLPALRPLTGTAKA